MAARQKAASPGPQGSAMGRRRMRRKAELLMKGPDNLFLPPISPSFSPSPSCLFTSPLPSHPTQSLALRALEHLLQIPAQYSTLEREGGYSAAVVAGHVVCLQRGDTTHKKAA